MIRGMVPGGADGRVLEQCAVCSQNTHHTEGVADDVNTDMSTQTCERLLRCSWERAVLTEIIQDNAARFFGPRAFNPVISTDL